MRIFIGVTSCCKAGLNCVRLHRSRTAIATAFFARACPITCLSSAATTASGVCEAVEEHRRVSLMLLPRMMRHRAAAPTLRQQSITKEELRSSTL